MKELVFTRCLLTTAEQQADRTGFIDAASGTTWTFGEHMDRVATLANAMSTQLGVGRDDRVAVLSANSVPFLELWHACVLGAAVMNPLNVRFSGDELAYVLTDSNSKIAFVDPAFADVVDKIRGQTKLEHVVLLGEGDVPADTRVADLMSAGEAKLPDEPDEESMAVLIYTGGTTGKPKGVMIDQRAEVLNQYHFAMEIPWIKEQPFLIQTPMFHGASMLGVVGAPMFGVPTVVIPGFEPKASMEATHRYGVGITVMVPTMIAMLLNHPEFSADKMASLRRLVYGASPMPSSLLQKLLATLPDTEVVQGYGMTEGCTILTTLSNAECRKGTRLASCGKALPGVELSVRDPDGARLAAGDVGEVWARGGNFMMGYLNLPEETDKALKDGWYHSGDVGYLDDEGYLFLVDRAKDMIISGGENVYSVEVENAIASHASVLQVAVIGVPHEVWGEAVHAVVVLRAGSEATEEEIIVHARQSIAGYKVPRSVSFREEPLPLSAAMKVLKRDLRAPFWENADRAIN